MKDALALLFRIYLAISVVHLALISLINNGEAMVKHQRGKKRKKILKEMIKRRYAFVWPFLWYRVIEDLKMKEVK